MKQMWNENPVRVVTSVLVIVQGALMLAGAFGYTLTEAQHTALTAFLQIVGGELTRYVVHAPATVDAIKNAVQASQTGA